MRASEEWVWVRWSETCVCLPAVGCADAGASPLSTVPPPLPPPVNVSPAVLAAPRPERGLQQAGAFDTLLTVINLG